MIKQRLEQLQQQRLSYHQILLMKMLLDSKLEFEDRLNQELEENPALETNEEQDENESENENEIPELEYAEAVKEEKEEVFDIKEYYDDEVTYKTYTSNSSSDDEEYERPVIAGNTFQQQLKDQIAFRAGDDKQKRIVNFMIDCLDETGYLRISLAELSDDLAFTEKIFTDEGELEECLSLVQECDPPGVGARNIKECLLLQLKRKNTSPAIELASRIISESFDDLTLKNYKKIALKHEITKEDIEEVLSLIKHLSPYPVFSNTSAADSASYIIPDFILSSNEDSIFVTLNTRNEPELRINKKFLEQLESIHGQKRSSISHHQKETFKFIRSKIESARAFVDAVKLRQKTLLRVVNAIIKKQSEFFKEGDIKKLKPMVLKDIAAATGMEISTISRITSSKYMQTPYGNYLLKDFFSEGLMKDDGAEASNKEIKQVISEVIGTEEKTQPLTDIDLSKALKQKGYNVARRTVTKYRKFMKIPSSKMRKDWR